ncbi:hypothetical protein [Streptomyces geranii]|uniref:hypothetical protein n=1 Tax=Streptomyces geranii TaxID=2058923 RepID=UPI0013009C81|nr:hypothetical protein [Streptomyces geranii]
MLVVLRHEQSSKVSSTVRVRQGALVLVVFSRSRNVPHAVFDACWSRAVLKVLRTALGPVPVVTAENRGPSCP